MTARGTWSSRFLTGYSWETRELDNGTWYWALLLDGERVNGGVAPSEADARAFAWMYAARHRCGPHQAVIPPRLYCNSTRPYRQG